MSAPFLRLADEDGGGERHAALTGGTEGRACELIQRRLLVRIRQNRGVILGTHIRLQQPNSSEHSRCARSSPHLDALVVARAAVVDVLASTAAQTLSSHDCLSITRRAHAPVAADEGDGFDVRVVADEVD